MHTLQTALSEKLLHFAWEKCYFDIRNLKTLDGRSLQILNTGRYNRDQGPDFLNASIRIGDVTWHGHVEIHIDAGDWYRHGHHEDPLFNTTILHVVWFSKGEPVIRCDRTAIPELQIGERIDSAMLQRYDQLRLAENAIACQNQYHKVPEFIRRNWIERLAIDRIQQKAAVIEQSLTDSQHDWEQVLWEQLAAIMGGPVNKAAFMQLARNIPYRIIQKYTDRLFHLEALLFGGSGLLVQSPPNGSEYASHPDHYYFQIYNEWQFLSDKYRLKDLPVLSLKKLRMRPAAFPTIRIAQLAHILHQFSTLTTLLSTEVYRCFLQDPIKVSAYWTTHYQFFEPKPTQAKNLGKQQKHILLTNVIIPYSWLYYRFHGRTGLDEMITDALSELAAENNRITRKFIDLEEINPDALYSQGLIQLYKIYCSEKRCLECAIGRKIILTR